MKSTNKIILFTKCWKDISLEKLADFIAELGLDGAELTVRDGYQVNPGNMEKELPRAAKIFKERGLYIGSVAGSVDERTVAACGEAGVGLIRIFVPIDLKIGYMATERKLREQYDKLIPSLDKAKVAIGIQNHCDIMVGSAIGIMHLIEKYDPKHVCAVLDPAHCAVDGEPEEMALDIVWSHLKLVNFKSASHRRLNGPDEEEAKWEILWTTAQHAGYSWRKMVSLLKARNYDGPLCLPAEYSVPNGSGQLMGDAVTPLLQKDIAYLKKLLKEEGPQA